MKIVTVIGARPQFIKAAPLSRAFAEAGVSEVLVHTGQHYDANMSDIFFEELSIPAPKHHLGIGSGGHAEQTGKMLMAIESVLTAEKPDVLLVYGDTNSTIAGALAASKLHIPVAHVEAGLRSYNMLMPEEQNRILTDHISDLLFCPTDTAIKNLAAEGIFDGKKIRTARGKPILVKNTGDIMYDAVVYNSAIAEKNSKVLARLSLEPKKFILATVHRAENTDDKERLSGIMIAFGKTDVPVCLLLHPRTKKFIAQYDLTLPKNVRVLEPVGYLDMLMLEKHAAVIMTDSGGVQKEAYFVRTPCITLRDETEWVETVDDGWNIIAGAKKESIISALQSVMRIDYSVKPLAVNRFGCANTGRMIAEIINNGCSYK